MLIVGHHISFLSYAHGETKKSILGVQFFTSVEIYSKCALGRQKGETLVFLLKKHIAISAPIFYQCRVEQNFRPVFQTF